MNQELNEKYMAQMKNCESEADHEYADGILCDLLEELGYIDLITIYKDVPKWYS